VDADAIILGASTIVFSGVVSGYVTYRLNRSKERSEFLRGKLETLFAKISDFHNDFGQALFHAVSTIKRKLTWEEAMAERDRAMAGIASKADAYPAAEMLVSLYFPDLLPQLRRCKEAADRAYQLQLDLRALTEAGRDNSELLAPITAAAKGLYVEVEKLREQTIDLGKKLRIISEPKYYLERRQILPEVADF
jgi:hypothetical protein